MKQCVAGLVALGLSFTSAVAAQAQTANPTQVQVSVVAEGLEHPWSLAFLPDGGMLVTERPGRLRRITPEGRLMPQQVSGLPAIYVGGQGGLFDVSPFPDFQSTGQVLLSYACGTRQANHTCLSRAVLKAGSLTEVREVFRTQPAKSGGAHFGGRIAWLPDGTVALSLGDGYSYRNQAQDLSTHFGKIVRIKPDGTVPADNPFRQTPGALPEIYSYGHRNVQGLAYDPATQTLWAHEHGPRGGDELNRIKPGANYGWPLATFGVDYSGEVISPNTSIPGAQPPVLQWTPSIAPSGLAVVNSPLFPTWKGQLLVGALAHRQAQRVSLNSSPRVEEVLFKGLNERIRDVRQGPDGAIYLLTDNPEGRLLRAAPLSKP